MLYVPYKEPDPLDPVMGVGAAFFPPGVNVPGARGLDVFSDYVKQLGLPQLGVFTPWATQRGDLEWSDVSMPPDTNVSAFRIDHGKYLEILGLSFNVPLPFLGVMTSVLPTRSEIEAAFDATSYRYYETQAVYSQSDATDPPRILFLHWVELRQPGDPDGGGASLDDAAAKIFGDLVVVQQVDYKSTARRQTPSSSFEDAFVDQFATTAPIPAPGPVPEPYVPPAAAPRSTGISAQSVAIAACIASVCGIGAYFVHQAVTGNR